MSIFCRLSVSGFVIRYSPSLCLPFGKSQLTLSLTPLSYGFDSLCCFR
nr:MAG TPA: hypothetical protein [Caudoviricetes sp.]